MQQERLWQEDAYAPRSVSPDVTIPKVQPKVRSAEEMENEARTQINRGADVIKMYADYRMDVKTEKQHQHLLTEEIAMAVKIATGSGRFVTVHATISRRNDACY